MKKNIVQNILKIEDYLNTLNSNTKKEVLLYNIQSKNHEIFTVAQKKLALTAGDDKRYILPNQSIITLAWGHYKIPKEEDLVLKSLKNKSLQKYLTIAK